MTVLEEVGYSLL